MASRLLDKIRSPKHKRSQLDDSTRSSIRPFAQQATSVASGSVQYGTPTDLPYSDSDTAGGWSPTHSRGVSTSSTLSIFRKRQHTLDLLFDPSDVIDIRRMDADDGADLKDPTSIHVQSMASEPEPKPALASPPPSYIYDPGDGPLQRRCILMAPVHEMLIGGQEATALLKALREEQALQLKAGNGFAGFNAEELERWEEVVVEVQPPQEY